MKKILIAFLALTPLLPAAAYAQKADGKPAVKAAETKAKPPAKAAKAKVEKAVLRKVTAEEIGKEAVCPVTGEKHTVTAETASASYKGEIYYFCCAGCDKSFLANPEKYAKKKPAAAKVYVCPMNDYQGDKPGKCPKCGMKLEEKK